MKTRKQRKNNCFIQDIYSPIKTQNLNLTKTYPHLNNIKLAESNIDNKSLAIGILVGADFYWEVLLEGFIKAKSGPLALNTKVSYVLAAR